MADTMVSVGYERKFSDGNYGSEGLSLHWTVTYEDDDSGLACDSEVVEARLHEIASKLRTAVLTELSTSRSRLVAMCAREELGVIQPPPMREIPVTTEELEDIPL